MSDFDVDHDIEGEIVEETWVTDDILKVKRVHLGKRSEKYDDDRMYQWLYIHRDGIDDEGVVDYDHVASVIKRRRGDEPIEDFPWEYYLFSDADVRHRQAGCKTFKAAQNSAIHGLEEQH